MKVWREQECQRRRICFQVDCGGQKRGGGKKEPETGRRKSQQPCPLKPMKVWREQECQRRRICSQDKVIGRVVDKAHFIILAMVKRLANPGHDKQILIRTANVMYVVGLNCVHIHGALNWYPYVTLLCNFV
ncbi:uncharacterized protein LOC144767027 [Lissotriton helveticus]